MKILTQNQEIHENTEIGKKWNSKWNQVYI